MPIDKKAEYLPVIIHEFAHSFVNPLIEKYNAEFKESGMAIYKTVEYEINESYIPNLVESYKSFAEKITQFDARRPKVERISEVNNNDTNAKIKPGTINFYGSK